MNKTQLVTLLVALGATCLGFLVFAAVVNRSMRHAYYVESRASQFVGEIISSTNSSPIAPELKPFLVRLAAAPAGVSYVQITGSKGFLKPKRSWIRVEITNAASATGTMWLEHTAQADTFKVLRSEWSIPGTNN